MTQDREDKIRELIKTSPLLDAVERAEWTQMLEIMNDKQVFELEKILNTQKQTGLGFQMPGLSHILNAPKEISKIPNPKSQIPETAVKPEVGKAASSLSPGRAAGSEMLDSFRGQAVTGQKPSFTDATTKQSSAFSKFKLKLSNLLKEKELPAGRPEHELELPEHAGDPSPAPKQPVAPQIVFNAPVKFEIKQESPRQEKTLAAPAKKSVLVPIPPKAKLNQSLPKNTTKPPLQPVNLGNLPKLNEYARKPQPDVLKPGLTDGSMLLDAKLSAFRKLNVAPMPQQRNQPVVSSMLPKNIEQQEVTYSGGGPVNLEGVEAVSKLTLPEWKNQDYNKLVLQFRKLISQYGYYEVMFSLERSPVFSLYLETGLKLLKDQISFENAGQDNGPLGKRYLSKAEFEKFADMLRQVQAG